MSAPSRPADAPGSRSGPRSAGAARVLVVDDSLLMRERVVALVRGVPGVAAVDQAGNPAEAMAAVERQEPDAVVLDLHMPGGSGLDVLEHLRGRDVRPLVIVLTNHADDHYRRRCLDGGADHFLDKSSEFDRVQELLEGWAGA